MELLRGPSSLRTGRSRVSAAFRRPPQPGCHRCRCCCCLLPCTLGALCRSSFRGRQCIICIEWALWRDGQGRWRRAGQVQRVIRRIVETVRDRPQWSSEVTDRIRLYFPLLKKIYGGGLIFLWADFNKASDIHRKNEKHNFSWQTTNHDATTKQ